MATKMKRSNTTYQVFLSFRGADTRQGFTDVLYHALIDAGIHVFRDDDEISAGGEIGGELLRAIRDSRIFVPIFSSGYASSKWCLVELAMMADSVKDSSRGGKKIIPIFYDVTPDDVKLKTVTYVKALKGHETLFGSETVQLWKAALQYVGHIKGWELKASGYAEFAKQFVAAVSVDLKVKQKYVTGKLVQRSDQQDALINLLELQSTQDVRFVWIHGMGGVGKTTLAKVVFNQLCDNFECCSFLLDVRETTKNKGIRHLQKQLLRDLGVTFTEIKDENDGISMISGKLQNKKVLIVIDDVYDDEGLIEKLAGEADWFGSGSRIIITSRSKRVPAFEEGRVEVLEAEPMEFEESLLLFSRHAFGEESPPSDFRDLSKKVIGITGGLPLALEVIGSQLRTSARRDIGRWDRMIGKLEQIPAKVVQDKLKICYDTLDWDAKEVFLDIACFFINEEKTKPIYMWQACGFDPDSTVEELVDRSLLKIVDNDKFWMHDQLRDLGRKIVSDQRSKDPSKSSSSSRIWKRGDSAKVLQEIEGKENVEMLSVETGFDKDYLRLTNAELKGFRNLRYLHLYRSNLEGDLVNLLPKLLWLSWHSCPFIFRGTGLCLKNLVVLDLSRSFMSQNWTGWSHVGMCMELKILDLTDCCRLTRTPNLSMCMKLERLILRDCKNLVQIDRSVSALKCLKYLDASGCPDLKEIPEEVCSLDGVEEISVIIKGDFGAAILRLPDSVGRLSRLKQLSVSLGTSRLPESIELLKSLAKLDLSWSKIVELPESIGGLVRLEYLSLFFCRLLKKLPNSTGDLKSLVELDISMSGIIDLPHTMCNLPKLKLINNKGSDIEGSIVSLGMWRWPDASMFIHNLLHSTDNAAIFIP